MNYKPIHLINGLLLIALLFVNSWIYINRDNEFAYKEYLNYNQLYQLQETQRISNFDLKKEDSLSVEITSNFVKQKIVLKLIEGKHVYCIPDINAPKKDSIKLGIHFTSANEYIKNGRTRGAVIELYSCNIPCSKYTPYFKNDWQEKFEYATKAEITKTTSLLRDSIKINEYESTVSKIEKIATYILKNIDTKRGIPNDSMDVISPLQRYEFALNNKSKVWCGDFASIFSFFASCANISTRSVCLEGKVDDVYKAGHSFSEVYIKELNKWSFVDLTSKALFVHSPNQRYLNTIDFYELNKLAPQTIHVTTLKNDSIINISFTTNDSLVKQIKDFYNYYFSSNNTFVFYFSSQFNENTYSLLSKIERYILKKPTFATYAEAQEYSNEKFYYKQIAFLSLLIVSIYCFIHFALTAFKSK